MQLSRVIVNHHSNIQPIIFLVLINKKKKKSEAIKNTEAMIEFQEQKLKMMDSQFSQDFQI